MLISNGDARFLDDLKLESQEPHVGVAAQRSRGPGGAS